MKIGLAPLKDHTDLFFIKTILEITTAIDYVVTPFLIDAPKIGIATKTIENLASLKPFANKIEPQIIASSGKEFRAQAMCLKKNGWDKINLNLGCPFSVVTKKKKGSALLKFPHLLKENLHFLKENNIQFSAKIRLGYNRLEDGIKTLALLEKYDANAVIIHARFASDLYKGEPRINAFQELLKYSKKPTYYNGDVESVEDFQHLQSKFPNLEGIFIGRGILKDIFLPSKIIGNEPNKKTQLALLKHFYFELFQNHVTDKQSLNFMKGYLHFFRKWLNLETQDFNKIMQITEINEHKKFVQNKFMSLL